MKDLEGFVAKKANEIWDDFHEKFGEPMSGKEIEQIVSILKDTWKKFWWIQTRKENRGK